MGKAQVIKVAFDNKQKWILKMIYDGLVRAGFLEDDNRFVIPSTDYRSVYQKGTWGMVLRFYPLPDGTIID